MDHIDLTGVPHFEEPGPYGEPVPSDSEASPEEFGCGLGGIPGLDSNEADFDALNYVEVDLPGISSVPYSMDSFIFISDLFYFFI